MRSLVESLLPGLLMLMLLLPLLLRGMRGRQRLQLRLQTRRRVHRAGEVFCNLDLDVAEVALARDAFAFLLVRVVRFRGSGGPALEAAVPVVRDERLAFVFLGGAVGVDVVDVGEVDLESRRDMIVSFLVMVMVIVIVMGTLRERGLRSLVFAQYDCFLHVEELLSPFSQVGWVWYPFHIIEIAFALGCGSGLRRRFQTGRVGEIRCEGLRERLLLLLLVRRRGGEYRVQLAVSGLNHMVVVIVRALPLLYLELRKLWW